MTINPYILLIHTTDETAFVALAKGETILAVKINYEFKKHATFLHPAIGEILRESGITTAALAAVSVTHGPGSYTGIRVGLAAAKGLCYALDIPLITISTLEALAASAIASNKRMDAMYCPMIDARRMEVYTAMYTAKLQTLIEPMPKILTTEFLTQFPKDTEVCFFGSGSAKWKQLLEEENRADARYKFSEQEIDPSAMAHYSLEKYIKKEFSDVAYSHPAYLKEFGE